MVINRQIYKNHFGSLSMPSNQSKIFYGFLKTFNARKIINKAAENNDRNTGPFFSEGERKKYPILTTTIDQKEVSTMGQDREGSGHIIYFHGGMYVAEANIAHKRWMVNLFNRTDCNVTFVDYPLAPEHTYRETIAMVVNTYRFLTQRYPNDNFILMGDSAGGGLALVLAQVLRNQRFEQQPKKLILYSPWVRLELQNPAIQEMAHKDVLLDLDLLQKSANLYAGESGLTYPYLSPYYGSSQDLGEMHVFYGGDEMLAPDIRLLKRKCEEENDIGHFYCYEGMGHDFQLFTFLPESKDVLRKTIEIIKGY